MGIKLIWTVPEGWSLASAHLPQPPAEYQGMGEGVRQNWSSASSTSWARLQGGKHCEEDALTKTQRQNKVWGGRVGLHTQKFTCYRETLCVSKEDREVGRAERKVDLLLVLFTT